MNLIKQQGDKMVIAPTGVEPVELGDFQQLKSSMGLLTVSIKQVLADDPEYFPCGSVLLVKENGSATPQYAEIGSIIDGVFRPCTPRIVPAPDLMTKAKAAMKTGKVKSAPKSVVPRDKVDPKTRKLAKSFLARVKYMLYMDKPSTGELDNDDVLRWALGFQISNTVRVRVRRHGGPIFMSLEDDSTETAVVTEHKPETIINALLKAGVTF